MKLWQKIFLGAFIASVAIFFFCGFYIVVTGLHFTLEGEMKRTEYYQSVYARKIISFFREPDAQSGLSGFMDGFREELAGEGRYLQVWEGEELRYDSFEKFPPAPRYTFVEGQAAYTPTYMKDIGDSRYLYVESEFPCDNAMYKVVMIKDLSDIYKSCDMQLNIFFALCLIQAFITAMIMFLITKRITSPIERLNEAAKLMAQESIPLKLAVEGEDEISELSHNFNLMSEAINRNIDDYKQIVGNLTHEIKTPLTSIIGYAELLKNHECDRELQEQALDYILEEGKRLNSITRKMIKLSRIQPGLLNIERQDVKKMLETSLMAVRMKAGQKQIHFTSDIPEGIFCYGDREFLITMMENVLDNAIKASHEGGVIEVRAAGEGGALAYIQVTDHGIGIPADILDKIDQPFFKGDKAHSQGGDGFGMGLAICKSVMQHHHGSLKYESVVGEYTTVTMRFPAADYLRLESPEQTDQVKKDSLWVYEASNIIR